MATPRLKITSEAATLARGLVAIGEDRDGWEISKFQKLVCNSCVPTGAPAKYHRNWRRLMYGKSTIWRAW